MSVAAWARVRGVDFGLGGGAMLFQLWGMPGVLLALFCLGSETVHVGSTNHLAASQPQRRITTAAGWLAERSRRSCTPPVANASVRVYRLAADFGGDPTGVHDASAAFDKALAAVWAHPSEAKNDWMMPDGSLIVGPDLGGATLDLEGGTYGVSRPVRFPSAGGGNMFIRGGTIRALPRFQSIASNCSTCTVKPGLEAVVEVAGGPAVHMIGRITFEQVTIDGSGIVHVRTSLSSYVAALLRLFGSNVARLPRTLWSRPG